MLKQVTNGEKRRMNKTTFANTYKFKEKEKKKSCVQWHVLFQKKKINSPFLNLQICLNIYLGSIASLHALV